jgi:hypothetical protein
MGIPQEAAFPRGMEFIDRTAHNQSYMPLSGFFFLGG